MVKVAGGSKVVAKPGYQQNPQTGPTAEVLEIPWKSTEPATRIERATCGLRIAQNPTSEKLNPQEATNQDVLDMGVDGADLSCPGSSVVADEDEEG